MRCDPLSKSDAEERAEGTDPLSNTDYLPTRLAHFRFDTDDLRGDEGQLPLQASGIEHVDTLDGKGVKIPAGALLRYPCVDAAGHASVYPKSFGARLLFKPDGWSSGSLPGGTEASLLVVGDPIGNPAAGYIEFLIRGSGTKLGIRVSVGGATFEAGSETLTFSGGPAFLNGKWSEVVFGVLDNRWCIWKDGSCVAVFAPSPTPLPSTAVLGSGFSVGSRPNGSSSCYGVMDEVELFNYPGESFTGLESDKSMYAEESDSPPGLTFHWRYGIRSYGGIKIQRRVTGTSTWHDLAELGGFAYTNSTAEEGENALQVGTRFDYRFQKLYVDGSASGAFLPGIIAGIQTPPILNRGRVLLVVENSLVHDPDPAKRLDTELTQFKSDLIGDGWLVEDGTETEDGIATAPRHDDASWSQANIDAVNQLKQKIVRVYNQYSPPELNVVILIGHVPVPYTGMSAPDGHANYYSVGNHFGAWSSDVYYGDLDGVWHDASEYLLAPMPVSYSITTNDTNDGKFDEDAIAEATDHNTRMEIAVGRIDFANLPVFGNPPISVDEIGLLRRYFNKNHRFRRGLIPVSARGLSYTSFDPASQLFLERDDYRHAFGEHVVFPLFPGIASRFAQADLFAATKSLTYIWGTQSGSGNIDKIGPVNAASLVDRLHQPKVAFAQLHGSWFGDWNLRGAEPEPPQQLHSDGLLQSFLATEDYGLAVCWNLGGSISRFAQGYHLGDFQTSYFDYLGDLVGVSDPVLKSVPITAGILGDPTLRWPGVGPPILRSAVRNGSSVTLTWTPAFEPETRYYVLRSESEDGPFMELSNSPVNVPEIVDAPAPANVSYQIRSATLTHTGCGSFWNPSQSLRINVP